MRLGGTEAAAPQPIAVPDAFAHELDAAVAAGASDAAAWATAHATGTAKQFDRDALAAIAPPPSAEVERSELAYMHELMGTRTEAGNAFADAFARDGGWTLFNAEVDHIRSTQGASQARHAERLLKTAFDRANDVSNDGKAKFARHRPYAVDPSITLVVPSPGENPSYPSGHATGAIVGALVLGALDPERAADLLATARSYAFSRIYGGVHFPSDVLAGVRLAATVATDALRRDAATPAAGAALLESPTAA
ncbi:MAG: phosphatase family protein [Thermoleophilia bacterium]|nr:phosphatase family protein [Thermoleophilia bacterium]